MRQRRLDDPKFVSDDVETIPSNMIGKEAIVIDDIKKTFTAFGKPPVHAVKGVSLKIYPGEITAILGEHGALEIRFMANFAEIFR